jgi:hypothetical protein
MVKGEFVTSGLQSMVETVPLVPRLWSDNPKPVEGLLCRCAWAYDFSNVFRFFAGRGVYRAGSGRLYGHVYVLPRGVRDLADGINKPAGNPDITQARRPEWFRRAFYF